MMSSRHSMGLAPMASLSCRENFVPFLHSVAFLVFVLFCFLCGCFLLLPSFHPLLLAFCNRLAGKSLSAELWSGRFIEWGSKLLTLSFLFILYRVRSLVSIGLRPRFDRMFLAFICAVWAFFCGATILLHEPWRDEVQAWLIARFETPAGIFHEMRNEGHFVPWFYLLFPFARLGFPALTLNLISYGMMAACVILFICKAPFNIYAKAAFVFTVPMSYYYPVISRCYCLFALCVFLLAVLFKKRTSHPYCYALLLGLLANSHAYAEGMVAVLTADAFISDIFLPWKGLAPRERRQRLYALAIVVFLVLFAFCQVAPAFGSSSSVGSGHRLTIENFFDVFIQVFLALDLSNCSLFLLLAFTIASLHYLSWQRKAELLAVLGLSILYMLLFAVLLYGASIPNRAWMWFFVLVFVLWQLEPKAGSILLLLLSVAACNPSVNMRDWNRAFSSAQATVSYMQDLIPAEENIYLPYNHANYALVFFAPERSFRSFETGQCAKQFSWSLASKKVAAQDINACVRDRLAESGTGSIIIVGLNNILADGYGSLAYAYDVLLDPLPSITAESYSILRVYDRARP